jgi:hypothetical protein
LAVPIDVGARSDFRMDRTIRAHHVEQPLAEATLGWDRLESMVIGKILGHRNPFPSDVVP